MAIMRDGKWERGVSGPKLAEEWGISIHGIEAISSEAWRRVQAQVEDRPGLQVYAVSKLKEAADASFVAADCAEEPHKERGVAVRALSELLKFADGVKDVFIGSPGWIVLSPERRRELVDQAKARIAEAEAWIAKNDSKPKELKR
jgi:hypothetical protein